MSLSVGMVPQSLFSLVLFVAVFLAASPTATFQVTTSYVNTCAVYGGQVKCWGRNQYGQLGLGDAVDRHEPALVDLGTDSSGNPFMADTVDCGEWQCCALSTSQELKCWGWCQAIGCDPIWSDIAGASWTNAVGDETGEVPMLMTSFTDVVDVTMMIYITCVLENHQGTYEIECVGKDYPGNYWGGDPEYVTIADTPVRLESSVMDSWQEVSGLGGGHNTVCAFDSTTVDAVEC